MMYDWMGQTGNFMMGGDRGNLGVFGGAPGLSIGGVDMNGLKQNLPDFSAGAGMGSGLGWNIPTATLALGGLQSLGNIWSAWQANNLAKKQFNFTKDITNTNLANSIKAYNTVLADRARSRAVVEGQTPAQAQAYIDQNKAVRSGYGG